LHKQVKRSCLWSWSIVLYIERAGEQRTEGISGRGEREEKRREEKKEVIPF
jgi:hypothetical protein